MRVGEGREEMRERNTIIKNETVEREEKERVGVAVGEGREKK